MELRQRRLIRAFIGLTTALTLFTTFFGMSTLLAPQPASAAQTVPYKVNFQGRLTDNSGNILSDGLYNIKFRMFDALTVGTNKYQEDRIITGTDKRIQITNGLFNIQFGDVTALSPSLFSGAFPLFLEVELPTPATATCATNGCAVFTEGAMTPRQPLASSAYAFNADTVDGIDAAALVQLSPSGQQTGNINVSGTLVAGGTINGATISGGTISGGSLTATAANGLNVSAGAIAVVAAATSLTVDAGTTGTVAVGGVSTGDILLGGGSASTGCTITNATGVFTCTSTINGATLSGGTVSGGTLTGTAVNSLGVSAGAIAVVAAATPLTIDAGTTGTVSIGATSTGDILLGGGSASTGCTVTNATGNFACTGTITGTTLNGTTGINSGAGAGTQRIDSSGNLVAVGNITGAGAVTLASTTTALTLTSGSGTIVLGSNTVQRAAAGLTLDVNNAAASTLTVTNSNGGFVADINIEGGATIGVGQVITVGATAGVSTTCSGGQFLQNQVTLGGITTGGTCAAGGAGGDLQSAYTASSSPATIALNTSAKDFVINATDLATDPNILFNLQCVTCSAGAGRLAIQDNGTDIFTVNPIGSIVVAPLAGQNLTVNLSASSGVRVSSATAPTVDQVNIDNSASAGVTTAEVDGLSVNYKGGAAAVEASGIRVDFTPGTTSGGTWSGLRIVAGTTGAVAGVTEYGLKLEGPIAPGAGTETAMQVGTGWDIGVDVQSGGLQLAAQTDPSAPTAGNLRLYAKLVAGRLVLKTVGPAGVDTPLQNAFWQNNTVMWTPGAAVGLWQGTVGGAVGTAAIVLPTNTNFYTAMRRSTYAPATAAANIQNGIRSELMFFRGNVTGSGGFFAAIHFGTTTWTAGDRLFIGFSKGTTAVTTVNPSTLADMAGFGIDAGDTAISFMHNDAIGTATKDAIAGQPALSSNQGYDAYIYMKPNDSTIYYRLDNSNTGAVIVDTSTATDIANVNIMMAIHAAMGTGTNATTTSAVLGINRIYVETDR